MNMKMLRKMQNKMVKIQEELGQETVEGTAGGGAVVVTMTGQQQVEAIKIDPEVVDPEDVPMLEDLILAATTEALTKSQDLAGKRLGALTGGMGLGNLGI
ncbi:MAG: YbaB/EbfC family nucleoid-associated protein [Dehalococcoidia bacterium]|nr:YbaB/EbfC family nucleoid-associated protein [Dehalococcoidia bacterium]